MKQFLLLFTAIALLVVLFWRMRLHETPVFASSASTSLTVPMSEKYRGVNWVGGDSVTREQMETLKQYNVNWIAQTPFGWQRDYNSPEVMLSRSNRAYWGERDKGLIHTTTLARQAGIKTLLKPHIWLMNRDGGKWLGDIAMESEADWQQWFANYRVFILHYAHLAEAQQMEALCIGTELYLPAAKREQDWRNLIQEIRKVYKGKLTYAANWNKEFEEIKFWDALDFIGIQGYFPLTRIQNPSVEALRRGWQGHMKSIEKVQRRYGKPIVFTEIGYKNTPDAAIEPWLWPDRKVEDVPLSEQTQANAYEALYQQFWQQPWFGGTFIWKWYPRLRPNRRDHLDFTPQDKPASHVMAQWYGK
ncbi:glycoside hydrolase family 113 [Pontibacter sp. CAU 1760]